MTEKSENKPDRFLACARNDAGFCCKPVLFAFFVLCLAGFFSVSALAQDAATDSAAASEETETDFKPEPQNYGAIRLQGLDKVTAKRERFDATMGAVTRFGNLEIIPRACWKAPPSQRPETAGLLEVWYWKPGEQPEQLFYGWMFASSPALSSLEHPVYDVTVLECLEKSADEEGDEEAEEEKKPE